MSYDCCIIGAGATGLSLLLLLQQAAYPLERVCIIDPHFDGGDLTRRWTTVLSNTPWSKTLDALAECVPSIPLPSFPNVDASCPLSELGGMLRKLAADSGAMRRVGIFQGLATQAEFSDATGLWSVAVGGSGSGSNGSQVVPKPLQAKVLVLATGSEPRSLALPLPAIPLEIALDSQRLRHYVKPGQRVLQFGTMHSGCLVLRNLIQDCSAGLVTAVYKGSAPFVWDRDGAYDGIKREAADIADSIVAGSSGSGSGTASVELIPLEDTSGVIRASLRADWVVYATGFQRRRGPTLLRGGVPLTSDDYDGATGALPHPFAWGFGIAYPNRAPDGVHWDVSVAAFLLHMKRNLPALLEAMRR